MKVFANRLHGGYQSGLILVAANTVEEAIETFHSTVELSYMFSKYSDGKFEEFYYQKDGWHELPKLTANVAKPQVIIEESYGG